MESFQKAEREQEQKRREKQLRRVNLDTHGRVSEGEVAASQAGVLVGLERQGWGWLGVAYRAIPPSKRATERAGRSLLLSGIHDASRSASCRAERASQSASQLTSTTRTIQRCSSPRRSVRIRRRTYLTFACTGVQLISR